VTTLAQGETTQRWPQILPGGKALLYTVAPTQVAWEDASIVVQPLPAGERKVLQRGGAQFAFADSGTVAYLPGLGLDTNAVPIAWMDRNGKTAIRLTFDSTDDVNPVWTPDGRRIVYGSKREGGKTYYNLYWQPADGSGDAELLLGSVDSHLIPGSWHPSGRFLAFHQIPQPNNADLMVLPMEGSEAAGWKPGKPTVFLKTPASEQVPTFSPKPTLLAETAFSPGQYRRFTLDPNGDRFAVGKQPETGSKAGLFSSSTSSTSCDGCRPHRNTSYRAARVLVLLGLLTSTSQ
jgi:hypothetical protein